MRIDTVNSHDEVYSLSIDKQISNDLEVDLSEAIMRLSRVSMAYQAAMQVGSKAITPCSIIYNFGTISMKIEKPDLTSVEHRNRINLPQGFGFPEIRRWNWFMRRNFFMWLRRIKGRTRIYCRRTGGIIPDYSVEITDADVDFGVSSHEVR